MLHGFSIGGFRNFPDPPQWLAPLGRVNVLIGANNSGKSNVLRYIKKVVYPVLDNTETNKKGLSGVDVPQGGSPLNHVQFLVPFDKESPFGRRPHEWQPKWTEALAPFLSEDGTHLVVSLLYPKRDNRQVFPRDHFPPPDELSQVVIRDIWSTLTGQSGGSFERNWYPELMDFFGRSAQENIDPYYIKTFREITTRLEEFKDEYRFSQESDHIIDELAELASPRWDEQHKKLEFEKLRSFVGELIGDVHVQIEIPVDRSTINVKTGSVYLPLEALGSGIHEVFMLAASIILRQNRTILIEEPEVHLHPGLQRKFMRFLLESTENQIFISTHSASIIDTPGAHVFGVSAESGRATIVPLLTDIEKFRSCRELGYKASDLLQANCVIWVEGPSDRIYLLDWIERVGPDLREGIHFSIMFYGGKLLSHLSASDTSFEDFINLLPISRTPAILIDSDIGASTVPLRDTKQRVIREFEAIEGFCWVTQGREVENYYSFDKREQAIRTRHSQVDRLTGGRNRFAKPLLFKRLGSPADVVADKIAVARFLTENFEPEFESLGLREDVERLVAYIESANH